MVAGNGTQVTSLLGIELRPVEGIECEAWV